MSFDGYTKTPQTEGIKDTKDMQSGMKTKLLQNISKLFFQKSKVYAYFSTLRVTFA
jgi:hypothetical protein